MGFLEKFGFIVMAMGAMVSIAVNIFALFTIYTQGDAILHSSGSSTDISTALGYMLYLFALVLVNVIVIGFGVFMVNYKLFRYENMAGEYEEDDD
jgi:hypothetical protein